MRLLKSVYYFSTFRYAEQAYAYYRDIILQFLCLWWSEINYGLNYKDTMNKVVNWMYWGELGDIFLNRSLRRNFIRLPTDSAQDDLFN